MVALYVALLIYFSISVDFGDGMFGLPTRQWPYTAHGRMMQGAVVPFLIAYLGGLKAVLDWLRVGFLRVPLLILLVDVLAIWEVVVSIDVFASQYNWYHLP